MLLNTKQLAEALGLSEGHVRWLAGRGEIPVYRVGAGQRPHYRFDLAEVMRCLRKRVSPRDQHRVAG